MTLILAPKKSIPGDAAARVRSLLGIGFLVVSAVLALLLSGCHKPAENRSFYSSPCYDSQSYLEMSVRGAPLPLISTDLARTSCADPGFPADRIAGAILKQVDTSKARFLPVDSAMEAPISALTEMFPEALTRDQLERSTVLSNWKGGPNMAVHVIRSPDGTLFLLSHDIL